MSLITKSKVTQNTLNDYEKLLVFMNKYKSKKEYTHSMIYEPYGKYDIPNNMQQKFMKLYQDAVIAKNNLHIVEKHKEYGPIIIELNFQQNDHNRYYTEKTLRNIIRCYNRILKKYLFLNSNQLITFVTENDDPISRRNKYYDTVRIMYPYICTKPSLQHLIRNDFIEIVQKNNIFKKIPMINSLDEAFNKEIIYKYNWLMYGSKKNTYCQCFKLTHIYHTIDKKIFDTLLLDEVSDKRFIKYLIDITSIRRFNFNDLTPFNHNINPIDLDRKINSLKDNPSYNNSCDEPKIDVDTPNLKNEHKNIYDEIYKTNNASDTIIAKLFKSYYSDKFIYDYDLELWYYFNEFGIYQKEGKKVPTAKKIMIDDFLTKIDLDHSKRITIDPEKFRELSALEKDSLISQIENINKTNTKLNNKIQSTMGQNNIIEQLALLCKVDNLYEKIDQITPEIIAFNNGVFDLKNNIFRNGKPEEFISTTTGYDYAPSDPIYVKKLHKIIRKIFSMEDEKEFTLQLLATGLVGLNLHEIFVCWLGPRGRNGKGLMERITQLTLGQEYCRTINPFYLDAKRTQNPGSADSFIFALRNCRLLFIDEISDSMQFDKGRIKSWSGNDLIPVRDLFQKNGGIFIKPKFMMIFLTNDIINIKEPDEAIKARLNAVSFKYRFLENPDPNNKHEKKVDNTLKTKFDDDIKWKQAFFQILVDQYQKYCNNDKKLIIPEKFKQMSNKIIESNDPIGKFIEESCVITKNKNDRIYRPQLFKIFKKHCPDNNINAKLFKDVLEKKDVKIHKIRGLEYFVGLDYVNNEKLTKILKPEFADIIIKHRSDKDFNKIFDKFYDEMSQKELNGDE
jgi:phage/plasmid-associated DNA primase